MGPPRSNAFFFGVADDTGAADDRPAGHPAGRSAGRSAGRPAGCPTAHPPERPAGRPAEHPARSRRFWILGQVLLRSSTKHKH